jgi:hypothetical protein
MARPPPQLILTPGSIGTSLPFSRIAMMPSL